LDTRLGDEGVDEREDERAVAEFGDGGETSPTTSSAERNGRRGSSSTSR
jgi:hypothetical protein